MLEPILQGLIEWLYSLLEDIADYFFGDIIDVLTMDMEYFRKAAPIVDEISEVILALAWALLIGNLVFQAIKSMMSGAGFDGEDPRLLFLRTFVFSFLLLSSRQICDMCSKITGKVVALISLQQHFTLITPSVSMFVGAGSVKWLIAIIVGVFLIIQMIKLFFDIGERYVISCVLMFMAPLAFAMGASKNTSDIFKGWCRMYGSMNLMLIMNMIFLRLIESAMVNMASSNVVIWFVFVLALTRVARKIDAHISKIGLNPAITSNNVGLRVPGGLTMVVVRTMASLVSKGASNMKGGSGGSNRSGGSHHHSHSNGNNSNNRNNNTNTNNNTAGRGQNASQTGDTNVNVSVNNNNPSRGSGSGGDRGGRSGDRNGRNGASTGNRYGNNSQSRSDRNTDTSRETNNQDNGRSNNRNSGGSNSRPNYSQPANTGTSQNPTPPRGTDGRSAARTGSAYANRNTHTYNSDHSSSRDNSTSHDRSDHSRNTSNPTLSRNTGPQGASSHSSSRASSSSSSNPRPPRVDVSVPGGGGATQNVTNPNSQTVQSPSRVSGTMAGDGRVNHADTDTSRNGTSSTSRASNSRGGRPSGVNHSNTGGNSSTVYNSEHSSTTNNTYDSSGSSGANNTNTANRRNDPASANRRGTTTYYTRDTGVAGRNGRGGRRGKA